MVINRYKLAAAKVKSALGCILFFLCSMLLGSAVCTANDDMPRQSREIQYIAVSDGYIVAFDNDPAWTWSTQKGPTGNTLTAYSPKHYYPPVTASISYWPQQILAPSQTALRTAAEVAIGKTREQLAATTEADLSPIEPFTFDYYQGYHQKFQARFEGRLHDIDLYIGRFSKGETLSLMLITQADKIKHIAHVTQRIGNSLRPEGTPIERF